MGETAAAFATSVTALIAEKTRRLTQGMFDTYRPELHYMRGPGPKWQEKHGHPPATNDVDVSGLWKVGG